MNDSEIKKELTEYCKEHIEHYLSLLNDSDLEMPRPTDKEILISRFEEFLGDYIDQKD